MSETTAKTKVYQLSERIEKLLAETPNPWTRISIEKVEHQVVATNAMPRGNHGLTVQTIAVNLLTGKQVIKVHAIDNAYIRKDAEGNAIIR